MQFITVQMKLDGTWVFFNFSSFLIPKFRTMNSVAAWRSPLLGAAKGINSDRGVGRELQAEQEGMDGPTCRI